MLSISSSDIIKKPSYVTRPEDITLVKDMKKHVIKSVVLPYALYERVREKIEDEMYLMRNAEALGKASYEDFLQIEEVAEDLI